jgi:hypothetical protein
MEEIKLINGEKVLKSNYVRLKTKDLIEFGYTDLTEKEVSEQVDKILKGVKDDDLSVIGLFCKGDLDLADNMESEEEIIGITGKLVDLLNENLTQEEWNALCIVHRLRLRLDLGIRFDWSKSIDVRSEKYSQIIDESVFLNREQCSNGK